MWLLFALNGVQIKSITYLLSVLNLSYLEYEKFYRLFFFLQEISPIFFMQMIVLSYLLLLEVKVLK